MLLPIPGNKPMFRRYLRIELSPWQLCLAMLAIVFTAEYLVMLALPFIEPRNASASTIALIDACLLTSLLVPLFWWMVVRPLHRISRTRAALLEEVFSLQEEERRRIARDLHDEIGQAFTAVLFGLRTFDFHGPVNEMQGQMQSLSNTIQQTLSEVRRIARGLRPSVLDHLGPIQAIEQYVQDYRAANAIDVDLKLINVSRDERWSPKAEITTFRVVQECLTNVARHARASRIDIVLELRERVLHGRVQDDGQGFVPENARRNTLGLEGMAERITLLSGEFAVQSAPGKGTEISFTLPLHKTH